MITKEEDRGNAKRHRDTLGGDGPKTLILMVVSQLCRKSGKYYREHLTLRYKYM